VIVQHSSTSVAGGAEAGMKGSQAAFRLALPAALPW
jgi:hypothetical protein